MARTDRPAPAPDLYATTRLPNGLDRLAIWIDRRDAMAAAMADKRYGDRFELRQRPEGWYISWTRLGGSR